VTGRWFSPGPPVFSTNKTDRHDITEILLKVALNTIKQIMAVTVLVKPIIFKLFQKKTNQRNRQEQWNPYSETTL
jgi:hypothetical protein